VAKLIARNVLIAASSLVLFFNSVACAISLDDFKPPAQGGPSVPTGQTSQTRDVVVANNMQDGLSSAYQHILKEDDGRGVRTVRTKTGFGFIASSAASYRRYDNLTATLLSKRSAYLIAFTDAQARLVKYKNGFENHCRTAISSGLVAMTTGNEDVANRSTSVNERCSDVASGMLSGFITYQVRDDDSNNEVFVSIASSTATRAAVSRAGSAVINSQDPQAAFAHVAKEIALGVVPPLGAKLIHNPSNGESIVVGFGSAIVRQNRDRSMMSSMRDLARGQSETRANSALLAFLKGSSIYWKGGFDEKQVESSQQFAIPKDGQGVPGDPVVLDKTRDFFLNAVSKTDEYSVITGGQLPKGVVTRTFPSDDGYWMHSISVYSPSNSARVGHSTAGSGAAANVTDTVSSEPRGRPLRIEGGVNDNSPNPKGPSGRAVRSKDDF
jgi:hypothetical protein